MTLALAATPVLIFLFKDHPITRWGIARSLDSFYSNFDAFTDKHPVNFGPVSHHRKDIYSPDSLQVETNNTLTSTQMGIEFGHEWSQSPKVQEFKNLLPFQVDHTTTVFEISEQVRRLTEHGREPLPDDNSSPIQYLRFAKANRKLSCRHFSIIYGAAARTAGYTTRMLALSKNGTGRDHAVCEVYVPEFHKWILIDPDFNIAYKKNGTWLNAQELNHEWLKIRSLIKAAKPRLNREQLINKVKQLTKIEVVELGEASTELRKTNMYDGSLTGMNIEFFEYVLYSNRNDYLSAEYPIGHPIRTREFLLQSPPELPIPKICPEAIPVEDFTQLYWPVGRTRIDLVEFKEGISPTAKLQFSTWTPNFNFLEYRTNSHEWVRVKDHQLEWKLSPGQSQIEVRSTNAAGLPGEATTMKIRIKDNKLRQTQKTKPAKALQQSNRVTMAISSERHLQAN